MEYLEKETNTAAIPKDAIAVLKRYAAQVEAVEKHAPSTEGTLISDTSVAWSRARGIWAVGSLAADTFVKAHHDIDIGILVSPTIERQVIATTVSQTIKHFAVSLAGISSIVSGTQSVARLLPEGGLPILGVSSEKKRIRSTASSLLKHAKGWIGDDLDERLREVYNTRSQVSF